MKIGLKTPTIVAPKYTPGIAPDYHVWQKIVDYKVTGSPVTSLTFNLLDPEVVLLCHFDNDLKDRANHILTAVNGASLDATQSKFGGYSAKFVSASSQYLTMPDSADWTFGSGDFTIDFWYRFNTLKHTMFWEQRVDDSNAFWFEYIHSSPGILVLDNPGSGNYAQVNWTASLGVWYHFAVIRNGTDIKFFIDGIQQGATQTYSNPITDLAAGIRIGRFGGNESFYMDGWLDEYRVVKGLAKYTANFTPPNAPYYGGGDEDEEYKLVMRGVNGSGSSCSHWLSFNGDTATNYGHQYLEGFNTLIDGSRYGLMPGLFLVDNSNTGDVNQVELLLYAKSGYVRTGLFKRLKVISGVAGTLFLLGFAWNNTADNIKNITVFADQASGLGIGTSIEIYRKKNAVLWWGGVGA